MENMKAVFKNAWPYQNDKMNLPVRALDSAIPFYQMVLGFEVLSREYVPYKSAKLSRNGIEIGLAENGGDPSQDGCFFEVDNIQTAMAELSSNGLKKELSDLKIQKHGDTTWKVLFIVAPDELCYCLGERQN